MPTFIALVFTVLLPLIFGLLVLLTRRFLLQNKSSVGVFAYPVVMAAGEFVSLSCSRDGTAGSLAYAQSDYLPIIQIASLTGIWGIVFLYH
jgi:apolipoprotein N-acyltransferase